MSTAITEITAVNLPPPTAAARWHAQIRFGGFPLQRDSRRGEGLGQRHYAPAWGALRCWTDAMRPPGLTFARQVLPASVAVCLSILPSASKAWRFS